MCCFSPVPGAPLYAWCRRGAGSAKNLCQSFNAYIYKDLVRRRPPDKKYRTRLPAQTIGPQRADRGCGSPVKWSLGVQELSLMIGFVTRSAPWKNRIGNIRVSRKHFLKSNICMGSLFSNLNLRIINEIPPTANITLWHICPGTAYMPQAGGALSGTKGVMGGQLQARLTPSGLEILAP